ncbi:MAG: hypothetical protein A2X72_02670 [Burkholderiales bacterium GWF1_66_17]|nr:MAG: hypothetical protein A2X73_22050 [Burkholderiales bacterium GWE1_65_30]OGA94295.1 MAG: hypothetical protein A2X72_02670 [Burkholderiales bacterium GWF1_66_17]
MRVKVLFFAGGDWLGPKLFVAVRRQFFSYLIDLRLFGKIYEATIEFVTVASRQLVNHQICTTFYHMRPFIGHLQWWNDEQPGAIE